MSKRRNRSREDGKPAAIQAGESIDLDSFFVSRRRFLQLVSLATFVPVGESLAFADQPPPQPSAARAAAPAGKILGTVVCTPPKAAVGESVCVEVRGPDGR